MDTEKTVNATFAEVAAMAAEERKLHPQHDHWREVDVALESLRANVRAYLGAAGTAITLGDTAEAESLRAKAALAVAQARPVWEARLAAAKVERDRVIGLTVPKRAEWLASMAGAFPPGRGSDVRTAANVLAQRLRVLVCGLGNGDETEHNDVLDSLEAALAPFQSSIGVERRESCLRVAAARAEAAVSAAPEAAHERPPTGSAGARCPYRTRAAIDAATTRLARASSASDRMAVLRAVERSMTTLGVFIGQSRRLAVCSAPDPFS